MKRYFPFNGQRNIGLMQLLLNFTLVRLTNVIKNLNIYPKRMQKT